MSETTGPRMSTDEKRGSTDAQPTDGSHFADPDRRPDLSDLSAGAVARLRALRDEWRAEFDRICHLDRPEKERYKVPSLMVFIWLKQFDAELAALDALLIAARPPQTAEKERASDE